MKIKNPLLSDTYSWKILFQRQGTFWPLQTIWRVFLLIVCTEFKIWKDNQYSYRGGWVFGYCRGGGGKKIKTTVSNPHPRGEILTLCCCQQLTFICLPTQSEVNSLASWLWTLSMWQSKSVLWGSWQAGSVQAGLKLWWLVICFGREMFLCNVFLYYNWK